MDTEHDQDPPEFDRTRVPDDGPTDVFHSGRSGRGLTNAEWDESKRRRLEFEALSDDDALAALEAMRRG